MSLNAAAASAAATAIVDALGIPAAARSTAISAWTDIVQAIFDAVVANAVVMPALLVAPPGGGPVTGTGTVL